MCCYYYYCVCGAQSRIPHKTHPSGEETAGSERQMRQEQAEQVVLEVRAQKQHKAEQNTECVVKQSLL